MINIIDNTYYKEGEVQLMLPIGENCTFFGPDGVKFYSNYGKILIDDYIQNPKRKMFPDHEIPIHKDDLGTFANQLFKLNKQYLAIYSNGNSPLFRKDNLYQVDKTIYDNVDVEPKLISQEAKKLSLEELKEKVQSILLNNKFLCFINDEGELYKCQKEVVDFELPLSGVTVFGNGDELKAYVYKMQVDKQQISIESKGLDLQCNMQQELENVISTPEPTIHIG